VIMREALGVNIGQKVKIAAGLFWADYGALGAQIEDLTAAGVDWLHIEMRDGRYMDFYAPRGGVDVIEAVRKHTDLEIEVQLQMMRPNQVLFKQLADLGANLISLPIETGGESLIQNITYIKETLGLKVGLWTWPGYPLAFFEPLLSLIDIVECESRAPFWMPVKPGKSLNTPDPTVIESIRSLHQMLVSRGLEQHVEVMEDGGLNAGNVGAFVGAGMTAGEFSSPLLKGANGKFRAGTGEIAAAVTQLRRALDGVLMQHRSN